MVLVDTSLWVDYLRTGDAALISLLQVGRVCCHTIVLGELSCGNFQNRKQVLGLLGELNTCAEASHHEVFHMIERHALMGKGIGVVNAHLLASYLLTGDTQLWTRDKRVPSIAQQLGLRYFEPN